MTEPVERELDPVITIRDIMSAGICAPGIARWIKDQGMDYRDFKAGKYRVSDFADSTDGYAIQVVRHIKNMRGLE